MVRKRGRFGGGERKRVGARELVEREMGLG